MAIYSSILVWKTLWAEDPRGLQSSSPYHLSESDTTEHSTATAHKITSIYLCTEVFTSATKCYYVIITL